MCSEEWEYVYVILLILNISLIFSSRRYVRAPGAPEVQLSHLWSISLTAGQHISYTGHTDTLMEKVLHFMNDLEFMIKSLDVKTTGTFWNI